MKKLFLIALMAAIAGVGFGQVASLKKVKNLSGAQSKARVNATVDLTNVQQDSLEAYAVDFTTGDIATSGDIAVGDDATIGDSLTVDGLLTVSGSATFADPVSLDSTLMLGAFGDAQQILSESSSNTNVLLGVYPMVNFEATAGKVFAGTHNRLLAITTAQANDVSMCGTESQFRLKGVNLAAGVHSGIWAYAEQSGTSTLSGTGTFVGLHSAIESASTFTVGASNVVAGVSINSSIDAGATINGSANYSGLFIESSGLDFHDGIYITGATNDIKLQNGGTIDNTDSDTLRLTETNISIMGAFFVTGTSIESDFAITDYQPPLLEYWAKTQELNRLPAFEVDERTNVMKYIAGVEEAAERNLRYIVRLESLVRELEAKLNE